MDKTFAARLRADGVDVTLDRWAAIPGDRLPHFMEQAIRENCYVLIVCTPKYKEKSDNRKGGVGYEGDIMTGEVHTQGNHRKFIPILRRGDWKTAMPSWLAGKYDIDLTGDPYSEENYRDLVLTLHDLREQAPPVGGQPLVGLNRSERPSRSSCRPRRLRTVSSSRSKSCGSSLMKSRSRATTGHGAARSTRCLSSSTRAPSTEWSDLFIRTWDRPPRWTTSHRPGIARVQGDRIVLVGTTIEEVQKAHRDTLKLVVDTVNKEIAELVRRRRAAEQAKAEQSQQHKESVRRIADDLKFN